MRICEFVSNCLLLKLSNFQIENKIRYLLIQLTVKNNCLRLLHEYIHRNLMVSHTLQVNVYS